MLKAQGDFVGGTYMDTHGYLCIVMDTHGYTQTYTWIVIDVLMDTYPYLCTFMYIYVSSYIYFGISPYSVSFYSKGLCLGSRTTAYLYTDSLFIFGLK